MVQLGNKAASNGVKLVSVQIPGRILLELFSGRAAYDVMSEILKWWLQSDTFMNAVVRWIVSISLSILLVARIIIYHVNTTIDECAWLSFLLGPDRWRRTECHYPKQIHIGRKENLRNYAQAQHLQAPRDVRKNNALRNVMIMENIKVE